MSFILTLTNDGLKALHSIHGNRQPAPRARAPQRPGTLVPECLRPRPRPEHRAGLYSHLGSPGRLHVGSGGNGPQHRLSLGPPGCSGRGAGQCQRELFSGLMGSPREGSPSTHGITPRKERPGNRMEPFLAPEKKDRRHLQFLFPTRVSNGPLSVCWGSRPLLFAQKERRAGRREGWGRSRSLLARCHPVRRARTARASPRLPPILPHGEAWAGREECPQHPHLYTWQCPQRGPQQGVTDTSGLSATRLGL